MDWIVNNQRSRRGTSLIEISFLIPVVVFLFVGTLDLGFYCYALISVQNAARVAALYTSTSSSTLTDATGACTYVLGEISGLPNIGSTITSCGGTPLTVTAQSSTGAGLTTASTVSVTYQSLPMIPIPGLIPSQFTWTRSVKMASRN